MKQILNKLGLSILLVLLSSFMMITLTVNASTTILGGGKYETSETLTDETLFYGMHHIKETGISSSVSAKTENSPQVVNCLEIPSSKAIRIVNYTYQNKTGWTKQTVRNMAKNYELTHPGWIVLAGVNGDFFDIDGKMDLTYQTEGVCVEEGRVLRPLTNGETSLGFKNDGSTYPIVANQEFTTASLTLEIIDDETEQVIKSFTIDKENEIPENNEISVYYGYPIESGKDFVVPTLPEGTNYACETPNRVLGISNVQCYANGNVSSLNKTTAFRYGQFAIVSENQELKDSIKVGTHLVVENPVTGNYQDCDAITGCGAQLLVNGGQGSYPTTNGDRHPRTMIGVKEDGTIQFYTVDGRQQEKGMYGMAYDELAATMLSHDCKEGYNLDGGGSTTMIIRNEQGDFDVVNSPSDGDERHDSNSIFVVVPNVNLKATDVTDTSASFSYTTAKNVSITDFQMKIDDQTYSFKDSLFTINDLSPKTRYVANYSYHIEYKGEILEPVYPKIIFSTGKNKPKIENVYYEKVDDKLEIHYEITDVDKTLSLISISCNKKTYFISSFKLTSYSIPLPTEDFDLTMKYNYDLQASPNETRQEKIEIKEKVKEPEPDPDPTPDPIPDPTQDSDSKTTKKCGCKKSSMHLYFLLGNLGLCIYLIRKKNQE
jgi:hypothetical protein